MLTNIREFVGLVKYLRIIVTFCNLPNSIRGACLVPFHQRAMNCTVFSVSRSADSVHWMPNYCKSPFFSCSINVGTCWKTCYEQTDGKGLHEGHWLCLYLYVRLSSCMYSKPWNLKIRNNTNNNMYRMWRTKKHWWYTYKGSNSAGGGANRAPRHIIWKGDGGTGSSIPSVRSVLQPGNEVMSTGNLRKMMWNSWLA